MLIFSMAAMLTLNCGSLDGNNPLGVTGGTGSHEFDGRLVGAWAYYSPYELEYHLTLRSDGTCNFSIYMIGPVSSVEGTWRADGFAYRIDAEGFMPQSGNYAVISDELTLMSGNSIYKYIKLME
jgi:hypothetical protein